MRIIDRETQQSINLIELTLAPSEARELISSLNDILNDPGERHEHISSPDYQTEITVLLERDPAPLS